MKNRIQISKILPSSATILLLLALNVSSAFAETIDGFSAKQSEVVFKAFDILSAQNWDQLTDENLVTLSQAAAIAMDAKNEHYNPKAAFAFMTRILEVQYDYKPLSELTQKVFKSAMLSLMRGDYRFSSERERVLRNPFEFKSDLRQMREMLKKAKHVEQRKANECLFVTTLSGVIDSIGKEHLTRFKDGKPCAQMETELSKWCNYAYNGQGFCNKELPIILGSKECASAESALLKAVLTPPVCANPVEIAGKLLADAPFINVEQIEKTLNNEDTELAFNMGLAVTDPAAQRTYHLIRDSLYSAGQKESEPQFNLEDEEFDIDGLSGQHQKFLPAVQIAQSKNALEELAEFAAAMDGPRYKNINDVRAGKPVAALPAGPTTSEKQTQDSAKPEEESPKTGFWHRVMKMFGAA